VKTVSARAIYNAINYSPVATHGHILLVYISIYILQIDPLVGRVYSVASYKISYSVATSIYDNVDTYL
jgi:hypothetical protein